MTVRVQYSTVQYSTVQHRTALQSTAAVQYNTLEYSTVQRAADNRQYSEIKEARLTGFIEVLCTEITIYNG